MSKKSRENSSGKAAKLPPANSMPAGSRTNARKPSAVIAKSAAKKTVTKTAKKVVEKIAKPAIKPPVKAPSKTAQKTKATSSKTVVSAGKPAAAQATKPVAARTAVTPKTASKPISQKPVAAPVPKLAVEGQKAPAFNLPRDGGTSVSLADYAGQKLVIFFYPRANTPGCTKEAIDFTRLSGDFSAAGAAVLGVSADPLKAQESFRDKHDLTMPLMSDETHAMLESYGAWGEKSMYGKAFQGVFRTTVLIGTDGKVVRIWRNVKVDGHADAVLEAARAI
jgi:peroxiredoxin Q/BCP